MSDVLLVAGVAPQPGILVTAVQRLREAGARVHLVGAVNREIELGSLVERGERNTELLCLDARCLRARHTEHAKALCHPFAERDDCLRYLWWLSAPMFFVFGAFSFKCYRTGRIDDQFQKNYVDW